MLIEIKIQQIDRVSMSTLKRKLKRPFKEKAQLGESYLMLKPILNSGDGNRKIQNSLFTGLTENLNLKGWNHSRRINGLIWLKENRLFYVENWEERNRLNCQSHVRTSQEIEE